MDWIRIRLGVMEAPAAAQTTRPVDAAESDETRARLVRTKVMQLSALRDEDEELEYQVSEAAAKGDRPTVARLLPRRKAIAAECSELEAKIANLRSLGNTINKASADAEHAQLMRDAGTRLDTINKQVKDIDVQGLVDDYREAATDTHDISRQLAEPIDAIGMLQDPDELDADVDALMQRAADEKRLAMPVAPQNVPTVVPTVAVSPAARNRRTAPTGAVGK